MSEGHSGSNVTRLQEVRRRRALRRLRRLLLVLAAAGAVALYFTGAFSQAALAARETFDSVRIALSPGAGWPVKTGIPEVWQAEPLSSGFVLLGQQDVGVWSGGGTELRTIQHGYARPVISAGNTRFCLYGRSGYELRVEGRTDTLYKRTFEQPILLAEMSTGGSVAVVTQSDRFAAELTVWDSSMEFRYGWNPTDTEGTPVRVAFARDNKRLAVACLVAQGGSLQTNLYFLDIRSDEVTASATATGQPLQLHWLSNDRLLAIYDRTAIVYDAATGEQTAVYSFEGESLGAASVSGQNCALLFSPDASDSPARLVILDPEMQVLGEASVPAPAGGVVCTRTAAYVLRQESVAAYSLAGEALWEAPTETKPLAVLDAKQLVVVTGGQAALLTQPDDGQTA